MSQYKVLLNPSLLRRLKYFVLKKLYLYIQSEIDDYTVNIYLVTQIPTYLLIIVDMKCCSISLAALCYSEWNVISSQSYVN